MDAQQRYRGNGQQTVTGEHVHVYEGGQAIFGVVNQKEGPFCKPVRRHLMGGLTRRSKDADKPVYTLRPTQPAAAFVALR